METRDALNSFLLDRDARNCSPKTVGWYRQILKAFAHRYPELPEKPAPIREFLRDLVGASDYTKHGCYRALRAFYNFVQEEYGFPLFRFPLLHRRKNPEDNPIRKVPAPAVRPRVMRSLSKEELYRLLSPSTNGAREGKWALRDRTIMTYFADSGARLGEVAGLTWQDVKVATAYVKGKTGEREVPLGPEVHGLLNKLKAWNEANFGPSNHVFLGKKSTPLTKRGVQKVVKRAFRRAGFTGPRCSPHTLRHTFGRLWVAEGGDQFTLQRILGHTTMEMVKRYVNMNTEEMIRQHQKFSPLRTQAQAAQGQLMKVY